MYKSIAALEAPYGLLGAKGVSTDNNPTSLQVSPYTSLVLQNIKRVLLPSNAVIKFIEAPTFSSHVKIGSLKLVGGCDWAAKWNTPSNFSLFNNF